jgi:hypothetical protein
MLKDINWKDFFDFKVLITETVMKWIFIVMLLLGALGAVIWLIVMWIGAFTVIHNVGLQILAVIAAPILVAVCLGLYLIFLRIYFEMILVFFKIRGELVKCNEKCN